MTALSDSVGRSRVLAPGLGLALAILAILTLIRLIGLKFSTVDLFFDEAQYWAWSREPAFGYFSKPPLLAWIIAIAEHICGSSEACIRAPAPILYFGTSLLVYAVARQLYDTRVAFYARRCRLRWQPGRRSRRASSRPMCRCCSSGRWRCSPT